MSAKLAVEEPATAMTVNAPRVPFERNGVEAMPAELVTTVTGLVKLLKVPEAPVAGAVKTTLMPDNGLPEVSFTVTASGLAKTYPAIMLCGVLPGLAVIEPTGEARPVPARTIVCCDDGLLPELFDSSA